MDKLKLDLSAATTVDYCGVNLNEKAVITFTNNTEDWTGAYQFRVWESRKKVTEIDLDDKLNVVTNVMTVTIEPDDDGLSVDTHYYEIYDSTVERVIFLGTLTIDG